VPPRTGPGNDLGSCATQWSREYLTLNEEAKVVAFGEAKLETGLLRRLATFEHG